MCGVSSTLSKPANGSVAGSGGSFSRTSSAAPRSRPERSSSASAVSSTKLPRATLTSTLPGFIAARADRSIRYPEDEVRAAHSTTASDAASSSRRVSDLANGESVRYGSCPRTCIPSPWHLAATRDPIRPSPTMPATCPRIRLGRTLLYPVAPGQGGDRIIDNHCGRTSLAARVFARCCAARGHEPKPFSTPVAGSM